MDIFKCPPCTIIKNCFNLSTHTQAHTWEKAHKREKVIVKNAEPNGEVQCKTFYQLMTNSIAKAYTSKNTLREQRGSWESAL